jgi:hypothetical protein
MISRVSNFVGPLSISFGNQSNYTNTATSSNAINLLILGDASATTVANTLRTYFNRLPSYTFSVSSISIGTTYTGAGITSNGYNVILLYSNSSQIGTLTMSKALESYVSNGKGLITAVFHWNLRVANFNLTLSPWIYTGVGQSSTILNLTFSSGSHPILSGLTALSLSGGLSYFIDQVTTLQPNATNIATWSGTIYPAISVGSTGSARLVGINYFPPGVSTYPNSTPVFANAILWAAKLI